MAFAIIKDKVDDILTATDQELIDGIKFLGERLKIMVEPTGCLGFSTLLNCKYNLKNKKVGVIISGGNIDLERYAKFVGN